MLSEDLLCARDCGSCFCKHYSLQFNDYSLLIRCVSSAVLGGGYRVEDKEDIFNYQSSQSLQGVHVVKKELQA